MYYCLYNDIYHCDYLYKFTFYDKNSMWSFCDYIANNIAFVNLLNNYNILKA